MKFFSGMLQVEHKIDQVQQTLEMKSGKHGHVLLDSLYKEFGEKVKTVPISMLLMSVLMKS